MAIYATTTKWPRIFATYTVFCEQVAAPVPTRWRAGAGWSSQCLHACEAQLATLPADTLRMLIYGDAADILAFERASASNAMLMALHRVLYSRAKLEAYKLAKAYDQGHAAYKQGADDWATPYGRPFAASPLATAYYHGWHDAKQGNVETSMSMHNDNDNS